MPRTKRVQVLMEPAEFELLADLARKRGASVSDLMRDAARDTLFAGAARERRSRAAGQFLSLPEIRMPAWKSLKAEIGDRRG